MDLSSTRLQTLFSSAKKLLAPFWVKLSCLMGMLLICWILICQIAFSWHLKVKDLTAQISTLTTRAETLEKQKLLFQKMKEQTSKASPDYLKKSVETMPLLAGEHGRVLALAKQFPDNPSLKERIGFLESDQNKIVFEKQNEKELHLAHRVQMDLSDLRNFLEAVEGDRYDATQRKPFLLVKKFDLLKCYEKGDEKIYSIDVEILEK